MIIFYSIFLVAEICIHRFGAEAAEAVSEAAVLTVSYINLL